MLQKTIVLSLGGSMVVQDEIQTEFLKNFRKLVLKFIEKGCRFVIVVGGGKICRKYQQAASSIADLSNDDKDWLGIQATRLNANLIRTIFSQQAYPTIIDNPKKIITDQNKYRLFVGAGWKPGQSTDFVTVFLANKFKTNRVINISNVAYVYDKDPAKFKDAKPFKELAWQDYLKIIGKKWTPGMNTPFDPIASQLARKLKMTVVFTKGTDFKNLENILTNKKFKGTIISS